VPRDFPRSAPLILFLLVLSVSMTAQNAGGKKNRDQGSTLPAVIWRDSGDVSSLNVLYGAGGQAHAPDPHGQYMFLEEDLDGTNPKFTVRDADGTEWKVKLGEESQSETAASRLVWAAGYFVDEDYYLPEFTVTGLPKLRRGQDFTEPNGIVRGARLERRLKDVKKVGEWRWTDNPFLQSRELNGLRVMMAVLNNWDLKYENNVIYEAGAEQRYVISDLGATLGNTGNYFTRSKSVLKHYARSKFIAEKAPEAVDFVLHSRPFILTIFDVPHYREYAGMEKIVERIPRDDARWLGQHLSRLSEEQLKDCFRAAGYQPEDVDGYTNVVRKRIADLNSL
jgi:hypothetical protein